MLSKHPKFRHRLNKNQIRLLQLLFKFRYLTTDMLAELVGKDRSTIYESLYVLRQQDYVHKIYASSYRLRQRPAIYCLDSGGIKYLLENTKLNQSTLRNFYRNKSMSEEVIDMRLQSARIYLKLRRFLGRGYYIATRFELDRQDYPKPLPELYVRGKDDNPDYYVDIWPPFTTSRTLRKRTFQYMDLSDEDEYQSPHVLFIAQNASTEWRLLKLTQENYYDFEFFITQQELLLSSNDGKVWITAETSDEDEYVRVVLG